MHNGYCTDRWVFPFMRLGNEQELETEDLYKVLAEDDSEILRCKLDKYI